MWTTKTFCVFVCGFLCRNGKENKNKDFVENNRLRNLFHISLSIFELNLFQLEKRFFLKTKFILFQQKFS